MFERVTLSSTPSTPLETDRQLQPPTFNLPSTRPHRLPFSAAVRPSVRPPLATRTSWRSPRSQPRRQSPLLPHRQLTPNERNVARARIAERLWRPFQRPRRPPPRPLPPASHSPDGLSAGPAVGGGGQARAFRAHPPVAGDAQRVPAALPRHRGRPEGETHDPRATPLADAPTRLPPLSSS